MGKRAGASICRCCNEKDQLFTFGSLLVLLRRLENENAPLTFTLIISIRSAPSQGWWYAVDFLTLCIICSGKKYYAYYADNYARILHEIFCGRLLCTLHHIKGTYFSNYISLKNDSLSTQKIALLSPGSKD